MSRIHPGWLIAILSIYLIGCGSMGPRAGTLAGGTKSADRGKGEMKQLAIGNGSSREPPLADPLPPPPPNMNFPEIPPAPAKEDSLVATPASDSGIVPATGIVIPTSGSATRSPVERARAVAEDQPAEVNLDALRRVYKRAVDSFEKFEGYQCKLTRRETVGTQAMPEEVLQYTFRKNPYSLHIKWIGKEAQGRELVYVEGKYDGKVQILTGREPELFRPSGIHVGRLPTDKDVTSKSRFDIREGGMRMSIDWFGRVVAIMEKDPSQSGRLKYLGARPRRERETGLEAVEETIPPNWEPLLPKGGRRMTFFDADPTSPSFGLPVLITTYADNGREVEYYWFDQLKPIRPTDADFDVDRLWHK